MGCDLGQGGKGIACHVANKLQGQVGRRDLLAQCNNNLEIFYSNNRPQMLSSCLYR